MKHARSRPFRRPALVLAVALAAGGCVRSSHHHHVPVFAETETNDFAAVANDFGVLRPGDRLVIEGHITDAGWDPFDGFAFTADRPLHVEFRLYADNAFADLDVCVFDPQIWSDVACYQTADDPEIGAVDVLAGGLDFHLVVESFAGSSTYGLEIDVYDLYKSSAPGAATEGSAVAAVVGESLSASAARNDTPSVGFAAYYRGGPDPEEPEPVLVGRARILEVDPATGVASVTTVLVASDGTWIGARVER